MFNSISSCGTLRFATWKLTPSMFSGISSCATLRFAPWGSLLFERLGLHFGLLVLHFGLSGFHFGILGLPVWHFGPSRGVSFGFFWPFGPSRGVSFCSLRPFWVFRGGILLLFVAFWAFGGGIRLLFVAAILAFAFNLATWGFRGGYPSQLRASERGPPASFQKRPVFVRNIQRGLVGVVFFHFGFVDFHFLFFWLSGPSFYSILAFGASILAFWALRGGILWVFVGFWAFRPSGGVPCYSL